MDNHLQELRRRAASGDLSVLDALDAAECRAKGCIYKNLYWCDEKWVRVEICRRCLNTKAIRMVLIDSPKIFSVWTLKHKNNDNKVTHAAKDKSFSPYGSHLCYSITSLCGSFLSSLPGKDVLFTDRNNPITCNNCKKKLAKMTPKMEQYLAETSAHIYSQLLTCQTSEHDNI